MSRILLLAALALCLVAGIARAGDSATDRLAARLEAIHALTGKFTQSRQEPGPDGAVSHSSGSFRLLRPSFFAWDIEAPDSQLVIADGQYLWHYDRDLETVTRRPLNTQQTQTPLQVLAGDRAALEQRYTVSDTGRGRFQLEPKEKTAGFRRLTLVFNGDALAGMEVLDNLGQQLMIEFSDVDSAAKLGPGDFEFQPPKDADLFYHDQ